MASSNFDLACEEVKSEAFIKKLDNDQKLAMYGFFKQATIGDNSTSKPGMFDPKGKAKWEAWTKNKGMSAEKAKEEYVKLIKKLAELHGFKEMAERL